MNPEDNHAPQPTTVREFNAKFEKFLQPIPKIHHPGGYYMIFLYVKYFQGNFGYLIKEKGPKTIHESK
jgi:hypothetical protein